MGKYDITSRAATISSRLSSALQKYIRRGMEDEALYGMYREQAKKKEDKITHAVLLLCRSRKSRLVDWALLWAWLTHPFRKLAVPDMAYDKHNERGRQLKRGWGHFFREGTRLENHVPADREEEFRKRAMKAIDDPGDGVVLRVRNGKSPGWGSFC